MQMTEVKSLYVTVERNRRYLQVMDGIYVETRRYYQIIDVIYQRIIFIQYINNILLHIDIIKI